MSSTEDAERHATMLAGFYRRHLLPLSAAASELPALRRWRETAQGSTYVARRATRMSRADFELRMGSEAQIAETLRERWKGTPLERLAAPLLKLAREFERADEPASVSAFIYEML